MKNYVQEGETIEIAAPYTVASGAAAQTGSIFGVAVTDIASGAVGAFMTEGVFDLAKVSAQAWAVGQPIYWDNSAKLATTVQGANLPIGVAIATAANPSSTGRVLLQSGRGIREVAGEIALDGSNPTPIVTGLTAISAVSLTLAGNAAPGDNTSMLTYEISSGTVNVYAWKNTSGTDPTLVASTGTETFSYIIKGY